MAVVGLVVHPARESAAVLARQAKSWLDTHGHQACLLDADDRLSDIPTVGEVPGLDVAVSLGGDGTMLHAVDLVADAGVPVIGVNLGQLGYLTEVEPTHLDRALERFVTDAYEIEERMRLGVTVFDTGPGRTDAPTASTYRALNEAVLNKVSNGQIARVRVSVDGVGFTTYAADGVIVATPTGSTAYAWSAGGPIVAPDHEALLLTPVAPHLLFDRSLVLPPASVVRLEVEGRPAALAVDGRNVGVLNDGDAIECTRAALPARFVRFEPRGFLQLVKAKFGLPER